MKKGYNSTRSKDINVTASQGILQGLAPDGGLFVPNFIDNINLDPTQFIGKSYGEMANAIFSAFLMISVPSKLMIRFRALIIPVNLKNKNRSSWKRSKTAIFWNSFTGPPAPLKIWL